MKVNCIPVSEKMPEKSGKVLVFCDSFVPDNQIGGIYIVNFSKRHNAFNANDELADAPHAFVGVTHWAEMIDPPEGWSMI